MEDGLALILLQHSPVPTYLLDVSKVHDGAASTLETRMRWSNSAAANIPLDGLASASVHALREEVVLWETRDGVERRGRRFLVESVDGRLSYEALFVPLPPRDSDSSAKSDALLIGLQLLPIHLSGPPDATLPDTHIEKRDSSTAADHKSSNSLTFAEPAPAPSSLSAQSTSAEDHDQSSVLEQEDAESEDVPTPSSDVTSTKSLIETFDWANSKLGPREKWPQSLKSLVSVMEGLGHETQLMWGEDLVTLYNEPYAKMAGAKHPGIYGLPCGEAWPEIWQYMKPNADAVMAGNAIYRTSDQFFFATGPNGSLEESHHLWMWTPIRVEGGKVGGILSQSLEHTAKVLAERRLKVLSHLSSGSVVAQSFDELIKLLLESLALEPHDIPFALIYDGNFASSSTSTIQLSLAGSLGAPEGHLSAPSTLAIDTAASSDALWPITKALSDGQPVIVENCADLVAGFEVRSWELPSKALVIPIYDSSDLESRRRVVLIIGLNSRRPFDDAYREWTQLLRHQILAGLTSVTRIEAQLVRAEELSQLDRAKTAFFSNCSHELRTPLTLIQGPIADLLADETEPQKRQLLELSSRNVQRLKRLVDMLMDVSRVEAGRMTGLFSPHQLGVFVSDLASMFRSAIEKGGLEYLVECDTVDQRPVYIDPDLFEKICWNLLSNAYKYCLEGIISVTVRYSQDHVSVSVVDTGVGIPASDISLVKERFHRVASVSRNHEGTGIGLSLVNDLVELHGGKLLIDSATADSSADGRHGSSFTVTLPYGHEHLPVDQVRHATNAIVIKDRAILALDDGEPSYFGASVASKRRVTINSDQLSLPTTPLISGSQAQSPSPGPITPDSVLSPSGGSVVNSSPSSLAPSATFFWTKHDKVLIVEDNSDMRRYLKAVLGKHVTVLEAKDGVQGLAMAQSHFPDLIISDVMMPNLDGMGLIAALRRVEGEAAWIPIVLITARSGVNDKVDGLMLGAEDYLVKPFSSRELVARAHLQMQIGKKRIDLERRFKARSEELRLRALDAEDRRKAAEFERKQQELLVDVCSHETRNTNSAISNLAQLCRDAFRDLCADVKWSSVTPSLKALVNGVQHELDSLDSILALSATQERISNDILSLARIQGATLALEPKQVDLCKVAEQSLANFQAEAASMGGIDLSLTYGKTLEKLSQENPVRVLVDEVRLKQILANLISNAIKFTASLPERQIHISLEVHQFPPSDDTCLPPTSDVKDVYNPLSETYIYGSVRDNGVGLSPKSLGRLFQRFSQATTETHAEFGGSGLGLFICRKLCDLMDGKIEVVSNPGEGSTFRFFLRTSRPEDAISPLSERRDPFPIQEDTTPDPASEKKLSQDLPIHLLVVEDNVINQKVLKRQLEKAVIGCDVASDGQEAIRFLEKRADCEPPYTLVLMDLEMPIMGGIEATLKIREMEKDGIFAKRHKIIALTGNARQWQIDRALEVGMDDVVLKPYKIDELLAKIRKAAREL